VKDAEAKIAAGDVDGAIAALDPVAATNGAAALKLGQLRETKGELDLAIDAYKAASATLSGAAKGEALGRMAVAQDARGMSEAAATADAAIAADPGGVWPTIAAARRKVQEGKPDEAIALAQKAPRPAGERRRRPSSRTRRRRRATSPPPRPRTARRSRRSRRRSRP
jgi:tetratricopeptide (TPR) repeat protein